MYDNGEYFALDIRIEFGIVIYIPFSETDLQFVTFVSRKAEKNNTLIKKVFIVIKQWLFYTLTYGNTKKIIRVCRTTHKTLDLLFM